MDENNMRELWGPGLDARRSPGDPDYSQWADEISDPPTFFDRAGQPMAPREYAQLTRQDAYVIVARDQIAVDRELALIIDTTWYGLNLAAGRSEEPILFQTAVFPTYRGRGRWSSIVGRWRTEEEATIVHRAICWDYTEMIRTGALDKPSWIELTKDRPREG